MEESEAILVTKIAIENKRLSHSDVHSVRASTISTPNPFTMPVGNWDLNFS